MRGSSAFMRLDLHPQPQRDPPLEAFFHLGAGRLDDAPNHAAPLANHDRLEVRARHRHIALDLKRSWRLGRRLPSCDGVAEPVWNLLRAGRRVTSVLSCGCQRGVRGQQRVTWLRFCHSFSRIISSASSCAVRLVALADKPCQARGSFASRRRESHLCGRIGPGLRQRSADQMVLFTHV